MAIEDLRASLGVGSEEPSAPATGGGDFGLPSPGSTATSSSTSRWSNRPVPWGQSTARVVQDIPGRGPRPIDQNQINVLDYADAIEYIDVIRKQDPDQYRKILAAMKMGSEPYLSSKSGSRSAVRSAWTEVVKDSALLAEQGQPVSPLQLLGQKVNGTWVKPVRQAAKAAEDGETEDATRTSTSTDESVRLTSRSEAERILDQALTQYLGRQATAKEVRQFRRSLNAEEQDKPVVSESTTTQTQDAEGNTTSRSSSTQSGGQDPVESAEDFAKQQEGYGEYQASTTYLDAFMSTLQGETL